MCPMTTTRNEIFIPSSTTLLQKLKKNFDLKTIAFFNSHSQQHTVPVEIKTA